MPLTQQEVNVGAVAYFDDQVLIHDPDIDRNDDGLDRPGPFVCIEIKGDKSVWCAITTQWKKPRLPIDAAWRQGGDHMWRNDPQYLVDGLNTYLGPTEAFIRAAVAEAPFAPNGRPNVTHPGVVAILAEVAKQGGPLLP